MAQAKTRKTGNGLKPSVKPQAAKGIINQARAKAAELPGEAPAVEELIDMEQAIEMLKTTRPTFYRWLRAGRIKGMKLGRQWRFYRGDVERFLKGEAPRIDLLADLSPLVDTLRAQIREITGKDVLAKAENETRQAIYLMVILADAMHASDIHLTAHQPARQAASVGVLRYRIDGVLHVGAEIDMRLMPAIIAEWKRLAACNVTELERPQDGRVILALRQIDANLPAKTIDFRVCFLPGVLAEAVTVRLLDPSAPTSDWLNLHGLGYAADDEQRLRRAMHLPAGLILLAGPTGIGKTTTLYSCLSLIARPEINVMTVEDPVEFFLPWVNQSQLKPAGLTFQSAIRAILRSAPEVIFVGEIRDRDTLMLCLQSALTGHFILGTLHSNDMALTLRRMMDMGADAFIVADATKLIVAQRLIRRLCPDCAVPADPEATRLDLLLERARTGGLTRASLPRQFKKAVGCPKCNRTGFRGRTLIAETLEMGPQIAHALVNGASTADLQAIAVGLGMTTMVADGLRRAAQGETTVDEIMRVIG